LFSDFKEGVRKEWEQFKLKNQKRIVQKTYSTFFFQYFHNYLKFYLQNFCGFDTNSLKLIAKEKISDDSLFLEYSYYLAPEEMESFKEFAESFKNTSDGITSPFGYLYLVVAILGVILRKLTNEKFYVVLDAAVIKNGDNNNTLNFLIVIKNSYSMYLYYFLKYFDNVPEAYSDKLLKGRDRVYEIALEEYSFAKEKLVDLLYYFYKKCNLLQNFSPVLDFLNFVNSRVEDSIFPKLDIIKKEFLQNFDYTNEKKNSFIRIFDYLDKKATLYATFQANNLPSQKSQFNLFLLYMKYYFGSGSLEALEVSDLLFLPGEFRNRLNKLNKTLDDGISAKNIKEIQDFMDIFSILTNVEYPNVFFEKIFNKNISEINYDFLRTFLRSLNISITRLIARENKVLSEDPNNELLTFKIVVDHICRMLYTLIDKIFIRKIPGQASKNFIDPRSRYVGRNIALRVLELFIFSDLNVSDDVWPDYIISMNKDALLKDLEDSNVVIPEKFFYRYEDIVRFVVTYNFQSSKNQLIFEEWLITEIFQSSKNQLIFEEWLITEIIISLNKFILNIRKDIEDLTDKTEIYEKLKEFFIKGSKDDEIIQDIEFVCQQLAIFWEKTK